MERRQTRVWLTAAFAAAAWSLVAALALWWTVPAILADLQGRSEAALKAAHIDGVAVAMDGRTAVLTGYTADDREKADAIGAVDAVWGVAAVDDRIQSAGATAQPGLYRFNAVWDGHKLSLTGFMPSRDAREDTIRFARDKLAPQDVVDGLQVAPGAPDANWQDIVAAGLAAMKTLRAATLSIQGTRVGFKGLAATTADRAAAVDILSRLPALYETFIDIIYSDGTVFAPAAVATGYRFGAAYDGVSVALAGNVPSKAVQTMLKTALSDVLPGTKLDDRSKPAPGAPDGAWADAVALALGEFGGMKSATLEADGRSLGFSAMAPSVKARDAAFAAFINLPAGYPARLEISVAGGDTVTKTMGDEGSPATACQKAVAQALTESPIVFASSSAKVPEAAEPLLEKLAKTAATCPNARLEVAGHTDASGNAASNIRLSFQRAEAVEAALIVKGVDGRRLTAKGYGADRPVAANDNDADKARNRRIEVIVRP